MLFRRRRRAPEPEPERVVPAEPPAGPAPSLPTHWSGWDQVPPGRAGLAEELAACPDFGVEAEGPGRLRVSLFDDVRALVGDDAIEALEARLATLDGVERCEHADREIVVVEGSITAEQLAAFVVAELAATGDPDYGEE